MDNSIPVTRTKIIIPRRRDEILTRQRLLDLMDELLEMKLAIIAAPAGYGKTSLLIDFVNHTPWPICWLSLDALDKDLIRFLAHFIASIQTRFPNFGQSTLTALKNSSQDQINMPRLISTIVNDAYEHITEHFVIILDDFHLVEESQEVNQFVNAFIQDIDENCHLMVSSRRLLTLPDLPLLVARNQVGGLSFDELAFLPDEIQALLLRNYQMNISEETALDITQQTEGWITGLLLSTQLVGEEISERLHLAKISGIGLYEYLAQQVLNQQSQEMQDFLLRSSLLEEFDAETCARVIGTTLGIQANWRNLMQTALQYNLFVLPIGEGNEFWLRYHHLFRDFLQTRIHRERPEEARKITLTLADTLVERREWERAYSLYKQLGSTQAMAQLIKDAGSTMVAEGKLTTLQQWLEDLPGKILNSSPALLSLQSVLFTMRGNLQESIRRSQQVLSLLKDSDDIHTKALTLVRQATAYHLQGNYPQALTDAQTALNLLVHMPQDELIRAEALRMIGVTRYRQGDLQEALYKLKQSLVAFQSVNGKQFIPKILFEIGTIHKALGDHALAEQDYQEALAYWQADGNLTWQANLLNNLGVLQHLRGDYETAAKTFEKSILCSRSGGTPRTEAFGLTSLGDLYRDMEAYREALDVYKQAHDVAKQLGDRFLISYLDLAEGVLNRIQGNIARAENLIESALVTAQEGGSPYEINLCQLELAGLYLATDKCKDAADLLNESYEFFHDQEHENESNRALFFLAIAEIGWGRKTEAFDHLKKLTNIFTTSDSTAPLVIIGREFEDKLQAVRGKLSKQVKEILDPIEAFETRLPALRRQIRHQASIVPFAPPKMFIQSFGQAQVRINNRVINNRQWQTQIARDLFFLFIAHPEGLNKEQVGLYFWPDSSPDELKLRFKNTLYRLRHAIGKQSIILQDDYYHFNWSLDYEYDAESFTTEYKLAQKAKTPQEKIKHYKAVVRHYHGPYLPEIKETWIVAEREQYYHMYLDALLRLTQLYMKRKSYKTALKYCFQALSEDTCLEEAHRLAMRIHASMGNRAAIVRQYKRCCVALIEEIGTSPSPQTEQLYEMLIQ